MGLFDWFSARRKPQNVKGFDWVGSLDTLGSTSDAMVPTLGANPTFTQALTAYSTNSTVRACVDTISGAAASVPFVAYTGEGTRKAADILNMKGGGPKAALRYIKEQIDYANVEELDGSNEVIASLLSPNPEQSREEWIAAFIGYQLLAGNAYLYSTLPVAKGRPRKSELYWLNPDWVTVEGDGTLGGKKRYIYQPTNGPRMDLGSDRVLHIKANSWMEKGVSALASCTDAVNQNTLGRKWNTYLLQNNGKPAAHANYNGEEGLDEEGYENLLQSLNRFFKPQNNGKVILTTNTELKEWGLTPNDMSWLSGLQDSSREICKAFRIAPQILGDTSAQTYANYREARQSLYMETVIPIIERLTSSLTRWYRVYDETFLLIPNVDEIEALSDNVSDRFTRANAATFLKVDERRMMVGYEPIGGELGDKIMVSSAMAPLDLLALASQWASSDITIMDTQRSDRPAIGSADEDSEDAPQASQDALGEAEDADAAQ